MFLSQYLDEAGLSVRNLYASHENTQKTQKIGKHGLIPSRQGIAASNITFSWRRLLSNVAAAMIDLLSPLQRFISSLLYDVSTFVRFVPFRG